MTPSVSLQLLWNLLGGLSVLGADVDAIRRRCAPLEDPPDPSSDGAEIRLPVKALHDFWTAVVDVTRDSAIGVRLGSAVHAENYGVVGEVLLSSATLGEAFLKAARYMKLWNSSVVFSVLIDTDRALIWQGSTAREHRHHASADAVLALLLSLARQLSASHLVPDEVHLAHPPPPDDTMYREVFGEQLRFNQPEYGFAFSPEVLTMPVRARAAVESVAPEERANQLVDNLANVVPYSQRVSELIEHELPGGNPTLKNLAGRLGLHPKTLMRQLKSEGTSHRQILDTRRRELAERYVATPDLHMNEVAFLLGFSDASAFHKSFKRWTGVAPNVFRKRLQQKSR